jgi:hypothetical protein
MKTPIGLLAILIAASLLLALACDSDDGSPQPTATSPAAAVTTTAPPPTSTSAPAATATPAATTGPATSITPAFRDFARQVNTAVANRDIAFFRSRAVTQPVVCTADNTPPRGPGGPACTTIGQQFDGFTVGNWRSEGAIIPIDTAMQNLSRLWTEAVTGASDGFGGAAPTVFAVGTGPATDQPNFTTVLTAMIQRPAGFGGTGPLRVAMVQTWAPEGNGFRLLLNLSAFVLGEEFLNRSPETMGWMPIWERFQP